MLRLSLPYQRLQKVSAIVMVKTEDLIPVTLAACTLVAVIAGWAMIQKWKDRSNNSSSKNNNINTQRKKAKEESWESHVVEHGSLTEIWPDILFTLEATGAAHGPPRRNMHIYRVPDDSQRLVIFNGIAVNEETMTEIESLGKPSVLVVPNCYHRCCAAVWKQRYPEISVVSPECAVNKAAEVVAVDFSMEKWALQKEWSSWIRIKEIDGWNEFETILEVELENKTKQGKRAVLVCDMLFTLPYQENAGIIHKFLEWAFDSSIILPEDDRSIIIPKVARLSRIFALKDWAKAELWFRRYAREDGCNIAVILVGHGVPVKELDSVEGCTKALEGVAEQLVKPRW
jgi:hypothetical protein